MMPPGTRLPACLPAALPAEVPPGKFWEMNVVRDCPKGLYRSSYVKTDNKAGINCLSCPEGWTTNNTASVAINQCNGEGHDSCLQHCIRMLC